MFEFTRLTGAGAAAALHALVFGEGERGVRAFYAPDAEREIHGVFDGDALVSALSFFPVEVGGAACVYMAGVCTHPDYRGRGLFRRNFAQAKAATAYDARNLFCIPANDSLFGLYESVGLRQADPAPRSYRWTAAAAAADMRLTATTNGCTRFTLRPARTCGIRFPCSARAWTTFLRRGARIMCRTGSR